MQFEPEKALAEATVVFWTKGYESTSLQDLLKATGLSKSSLYQTFGNKHTLFERCLGHYRETLAEHMAEKLAAADSGLGFLREVLNAVAAEADARGPRRGCLLINTATEFAGRDARVAKEVKLGTGRILGVFEEAIAKAQATGEIDVAEEPRALAQFVMTTISGMRAMVKAGLPRAALEKTAALALKAMR